MTFAFDNSWRMGRERQLRSTGSTIARFRGDRPAVQAAQAPSLLDLLFAFSIVVYPANAAIGLDVLGEARSEPYILINLFLSPLAAVHLYRRGLRTERLLLLFATAFLAAVAISIIANFSSILGNQLKGRSGLSRLLSTTMVPMFGFYFAYLVYFYSTAAFRTLLAAPLFWGAVLVVAVGDVELVSWKVDAVYNIFLQASGVIHALMRRGHFIIGRIQSVTYEASNFGMYAIFTLPWLWAFANQRSSALRRLACWALFLNLLALSFLSGRTSLVGVLPVVLLIPYLRLFLVARGGAYQGLHHALMACYLVLSIAPLIAVALYQNEIAAAAIASDNISNVSRFGTMAIQINEFLTSPAFGIGMGQYPFKVTQLFPSWADTWEFQKWITDPDASFFPSFSLYSRILAELGAVGYAVWLFFCTLLLGKVAATAHRFYLQHGAFPYIGAAIICGFFGLQFSGWVIASYKIPYIWLVLGLAVAYIKSPPAMESKRPERRLDLEAARRHFPVSPRRPMEVA
ncbi:hypothetical protein [Bradyrhizobium sp.]|uniref:hypothetical protein n=1 Tax=Bradyrhizobium sp. TaxID=376 RepID=UPI001EB9FEF9|nr:hypothetical protein [Bradyrhizobium sp.]MBV8923643.1 hypothetical protein [Bradyrhizobium sp.]MBV9984828.1 hypothetical protein [Bradyrhizobium sp.]